MKASISIDSFHVDPLVIAQVYQPCRSEKPSLTSLPSEILMMVVKQTDPMGVTCLSLTSKWFALHGLASTIAIFPSKKARYANDKRRITFLNLLKGWMPEEYRMCYICRTFRPVSGGHLQTIVEDVHPHDEAPPDKKHEAHTMKKIRKTILWSGEDWTFVTLGKKISKRGVQETRTYCPGCMKEVANINIGRKGTKKQKKSPGDEDEESDESTE
jgi:hypothetical protein